jgi:hypothetical protein
MRRIIRGNEIQKGKSEILNIFFGLSKGDLPEEYTDLHRSYLEELKGEGCSSCKKTAIQRKYKKKVLEVS